MLGLVQFEIASVIDLRLIGYWEESIRRY
jgi:hypothetical protein